MYLVCVSVCVSVLHLQVGVYEIMGWRKADGPIMNMPRVTKSIPMRRGLPFMCGLGLSTSIAESASAAMLPIGIEVMTVECIPQPRPLFGLVEAIRDLDVCLTKPRLRPSRWTCKTIGLPQPLQRGEWVLGHCSRAWHAVVQSNMQCKCRSR